MAQKKAKKKTVKRSGKNIQDDLKKENKTSLFYIFNRNKFINGTSHIFILCPILPNILLHVE